MNGLILKRVGELVTAGVLDARTPLHFTIWKLIDVECTLTNLADKAGVFDDGIKLKLDGVRSEVMMILDELADKVTGETIGKGVKP